MVFEIKKNLEFDKENLGKYSKLLFSFKSKSANEIKYLKDRNLKILRILCQQPFFTGSGINLVNLTKITKKNNIKQSVIFGHPAGEPNPLSDILDSTHIFPVLFFNPHRPTIDSDLPFPVVGMSDEMPYESTKFSSFDKERLEIYLEKFAAQIEHAVNKFKPTIIHSHHLWLTTALSRVLCPEIPIIATCHNTALRQMKLSPQLQNLIKKPIQAVDVIAVIDNIQQNRVEKLYEFPQNLNNRVKFLHIGQGINTHIFYPPEKPKKRASNDPINLIYVGKLSFSKGVPQLIKAFQEIVRDIDLPLRLNIIGSGQGSQKEKILSLGQDCGENVCFLGQLEQEALAKYFRESDLFILPSFYDGFPKVLLEALSSGCRAIITDLPGIKATLERSCGPNERVKFLQMPKMKTVDKPLTEQLPEFRNNLKSLIKEQIELIQKTQTNNNYAHQIRKNFGKTRLFQTYLDKYKELLN